jgi:aspartyl/asparaginyl-tRNA synthetase
MYQQSIINSKQYHQVSMKLRSFFESKGFIEVATQSRLSILSACEDPSTIATFQYCGNVWPLKQTGQMDLEYELLNNPDYNGVYCHSTSYRQEADPIPGRHDLIFPMFEFEAKGEMNDLIKLEEELLEYMGFPTESSDKLKRYLIEDYTHVAQQFGKKELSAEDEERIWKEISSVFFIKNFPEYTSPFWNMKRNGTRTANKVDVILYGIETIGSDERETDPNIMYERFHDISDGKYAELLYSHFGKYRVLKELNEFLDLEMFPRYGGGIGMTRMIRAMNYLNKN